MNFKDYSPKQSFLLPPSIESFLGESHEAVILSEFLVAANTKSLIQSYKNEKGGSSAYHPVMLLAVLIYGYMNGVFSSRQLAKNLKYNLAFMYLAGSLTPDFRTLARFRKEKGIYLENIFTAVVRRAEALGLINFGICCLDGTKIYASASTSRNKNQKMAKSKIRAIMAEADKIDQMEDELFGDKEDGEDELLKTKTGREQRRKELEEQQKQAEDDLDKLNDLEPTDEDTKINTTDPDSKLMRMKRKDFANGYNVQNITENGIILSSFISNHSNDLCELIPSLKKLQSNLINPKILLADKGYASEANYLFCEQNNINAYIPNCSESIDLTNYVYDEQHNNYTDNQGNIYRFKQHMKKREGQSKRGRPNKSTESMQEQIEKYQRTIYEYRDNQTGKKKYLCISPKWQNYVKQQKEKLSTWQGKQIYKQRMHDVEGVFGNIKRNLNFDSFSLRGLKGVNIEWTLISLAHNLKKIL